MTNPYLIVIGASAGGLETLRELVAGLPAEFPAPIAIVMHMAPESPGLLPEILTRAGRLTARTPRHGERLQTGRIYVAPPDYHLLVEPGRLRLSKGPRENRFRPAIDPLFRSAAQVYGPRAIGVILSGNLDDGTAGLWAIRQLGGIAVVQSPEDALFPSMPDNALRHVRVDHVLPVAQIPALLSRLTADTLPAPEPAVMAPHNLDLEVRIAGEDDPLRAGVTSIGPPGMSWGVAGGLGRRTRPVPLSHRTRVFLVEPAGGSQRRPRGHAVECDPRVAGDGAPAQDAWSGERRPSDTWRWRRPPGAQ